MSTKKLKNIIFAIILFSTLLGCGKSKYDYYKLELENNLNSKGITISNLTDQDIYNLKATKDYYCFLTKKDKYTMHIYKNDHNHIYKQILPADSLPNQNEKYYFTKEVSHKSNSNILYITRDKKQLMKLHITDDYVDIDTLTTSIPPSSKEYNILSNTYYVSTLQRADKSPYYRFSNSEFLWTKPDTLIKKKIGNSVSYINHLCVSDKHKRAVVAYRFVNFLSFYDLDGNLQCTVEIGTNKFPHEIELGDANITKYFIDIYGTEKYVYCLYSGSSDLSVPSRILKFNWNGKHINTFLLDRPIQQFAVNEKKKCIIAISSYNTEGQDIIEYKLE